MPQRLRALLLASGLFWPPLFMIASTCVAADPLPIADGEHLNAKGGTGGGRPALNHRSQRPRRTPLPEPN